MCLPPKTWLINLKFVQTKAIVDMAALSSTSTRTITSKSTSTRTTTFASTSGITSQ